jgi:AAA domain/UvrD-like helicase C-terminal domain
MAHIHPSISTLHPATLGAHRERDILQLLQQGLPDSFDVFHSVAMSAVHHGEQKFGELEGLCQRIRQNVPTHAINAADRLRVIDFLENKFQLHPDVSSYVGQLERTSVALSDGLAIWVPRITSSAGVYTVQASAGSGKTQLAVALLREAVAKGERCAYVCFNRPLADHMVRIAPPRANVTTFHELCVDHYRQHLAKKEIHLDFGQANVFADATAQYVLDAESKIPTLDLLIIDEAQDFDPEWVSALLAQLKTKARLYVLGDTNQDLYGRGTFELPEAVHITSPDNFRSPRAIVRTINALQLTDQPVVAKSLFEGWEPEWHSYKESDKGGLQCVQKCVERLLADGVALNQIVLLSFAGTFDGAGNAKWTQGELLADTLHRFKGQAAPVVVLCEIDFEGEPNSRDLKKLFVGFTRAQFRLACVVSERAEAALASRL